MIPFLRRSTSTSSSSSSSTVVLDFLAPSTSKNNFNTVRYNSTQTNSTTSKTTRINSPIASTSTSTSSNNDVKQKPRRRNIKDINQSALNKSRIDPFSLLKEIRSTSAKNSTISLPPSTPSASTNNNRSSDYSPIVRNQQSIESKSNEALRSLLEGVHPKSSSFELAFERGWNRLKLVGEIGRVPLSSYPILLHLAKNEFKKGEEKSKISWNEFRELILWIASSGQKLDSISIWAWDSMREGNYEGSSRVVDIWESIMSGEAKRLRLNPNGLDSSSKPDFPKNISSNEVQTKGTVLDAELFAAFVVAKSILHTSASFHHRFSTLLPSFTDSSNPSLSRYLSKQRATPKKQLETIFKNTITPTISISKAESWLRQVHLAQNWLRTTGAGKGNGLGIINQINIGFRRGDTSVAARYWEAIKEGVDSIEMGWIENKWESTRGDHLLEGMSSASSLGNEVEDNTASPLPSEEVALPSSTTESSTLESTSSDHKIKSSHAYLTEAFLAPFLIGFVSAKEYEQATEIWSWLENPSAPLLPGVVCWTALLKGYASSGDIEAAETVFSQMQEKGIKPDAITWISLIDCYFHAKDLNKAVEVLQKMFSNKDLRESLKGGKFDEEVYKKIINGFLTENKLEQAKLVLEDMIQSGVQPTIYTYNLFIRHYTNTSKADFPSIVKTLRLISDQNLKADVFTFTMILKGLLSMSQPNAVTKLISIMENSGVKPTITTYGSIIHSLTVSGKPDQLKASLELLDEMESAGLITNEIIYTSIIQGFLKAIKLNPIEGIEQGSMHPYLQAALTLRNRMEKRGIPMNRIGYNAIIDAALFMNSEIGTKLAFHTFKGLQSKLAHTSNYYSENTSKPVEEMNNKGTTSADTYYVLLNGLAQNGDWSNARGVLRMMESEKFIVKSKNLMRLVDDVRRGGFS